MKTPDLLALPLPEAIKQLEKAGTGYTVTLSEAKSKWQDTELEGVATEYVVRQNLLPDNKVALVTVKRYRKEVL